jgi:hypothetical protein
LAGFRSKKTRCDTNEEHTQKGNKKGPQNGPKTQKIKRIKEAAGSQAQGAGTGICTEHKEDCR